MPERCVKNEFTKLAVQKHWYKKSKFSLIVGRLPNLRQKSKQSKTMQILLPKIANFINLAILGDRLIAV